MTSIIDKIHNDYISAMKAGNTDLKNALSLLKAALINAEKLTGNKLSDAEALKVIAKESKSRYDNYEFYLNHSQIDRARNELFEYHTIKAYLPEELTEEVITKLIHTYLGTMQSITNRNVLSGKTMGLLNSNYPGQFNRDVATKLINSILDSKSSD